MGPIWLEYLTQNKIKYCIRLRNIFKVSCFDKNEEQPVFRLFNKLKKGEFYHHPKIVIINGIKCYVFGIKNYDRQGKLDFLILVSFNNPEKSLELQALLTNLTQGKALLKNEEIKLVKKKV